MRRGEYGRIEATGLKAHDDMNVTEGADQLTGQSFTYNAKFWKHSDFHIPHPDKTLPHPRQKPLASMTILVPPSQGYLTNLPGAWDDAIQS